jgi:hypothetical protein
MLERVTILFHHLQKLLHQAQFYMQLQKALLVLFRLGIQLHL